MLYISGISSRRPDNTWDGVTVEPDGTVILDITKQTRAVIENIKAILHAAGLGLENLVDLTVFLVDMKDYAEFNKVYNEYFDAQSGKVGLLRAGSDDGCRASTSQPESSY